MAGRERASVRLTLRNGRTLEAVMGLPTTQTLAAYLSATHGWLNLTSVVWEGDGASGEMEHLAIQVGQILWATTTGPLREGEGGATRERPRRRVQLVLDTGAMPVGELALMEEQRLGDYLSSTGTFIPFFAPRELTGEAPREVAVARAAIVGAREVGG